SSPVMQPKSRLCGHAMWCCATNQAASSMIRYYYALQMMNFGSRFLIPTSNCGCVASISGSTLMSIFKKLMLPQFRSKAQNQLIYLCGEEVDSIPFFGIMSATLADHDVLISQTGFSGEKGYEIYLYDAYKYADDLWNAILQAGKKHQLSVIAPTHHRRIAAGILSWGQDMDQEILPFQANLAYQVPRHKEADYIGKTKLEKVRAQLDAGDYPFTHQLVGMVLGGAEIDD